jgi:hypothetical protein
VATVSNIGNKQSQAKQLEITCVGPSGRVRFRQPPTFEAAGGSFAHRVDVIMQYQKDPMPISIILMTCCIIPMTVIIVLMVAIIAPMTCSGVFTVGGGFSMMGERCGTGNPAGGTVNASMWHWMDSAPQYHLNRESTAYAGVLLDEDGSMKWHRQKKRT